MWLCFSLAELQTICQMYWHRIYNLEGDKYELERAIEIRKMEVNCIIRIGNAYDMIWVGSDLVVTTWHDSCTAHRTHAHVAPRRVVRLLTPTPVLILLAQWYVFPFSIAMLKRIIQEYYDRLYVCEGQKWDLEHEVRKRDYEVLTNTL